MNIIAFVGSYLIARVADQGLANTMGLATLRHGTNPISWIGIHILGAQPSMGGSKFGGEQVSCLLHQNINRFYFALDSDFYQTKPSTISEWLKQKKEMRRLPEDYAVRSTENLIFALTGFDNIPIRVLSLRIGLLLPTIKFRYSNEEALTFKKDLSYLHNLACSTDQRQSPLNIGIVGTVWKSLSLKTPSRMLSNPFRVIIGIAELAFCAIAAYFAIQTMPLFLASHKVALVAGAFFASI